MCEVFSIDGIFHMYDMFVMGDQVVDQEFCDSQAEPVSFTNFKLLECCSLVKLLRLQV